MSLPIPPPAPPPSGLPRPHPEADSVLALGLLALATLGVAAPFAWVRANRVLREIDAAPTSFVGRDRVLLGKALGILGTAILVMVPMLIAFFLLSLYWFVLR